MEHMFDITDAEPWRRIDRCSSLGVPIDWVYVGECVACGRGVDRDFPNEYRIVASALHCRECIPNAQGAIQDPRNMEPAHPREREGD